MIPSSPRPTDDSNVTDRVTNFRLQKAIDFTAITVSFVTKKNLFFPTIPEPGVKVVSVSCVVNCPNEFFCDVFCG